MLKFDAGKSRIHNHFDVEVRDAATGAVKQKICAYNVVLDQALTTPENYFKYLAIGNGSGTPATTDTALFHGLGTYWISNITSSYDARTKTWTKTGTVTLDVNKLNGYNLSECGLARDFPESIYLGTHALFRDSEGNPITIPKNDTTVVVITCVAYMTLTDNGMGDGGIYPTQSYLAGLFGFGSNPVPTTCQFAADIADDGTPVGPCYAATSASETTNSTAHTRTVTGIFDVTSTIVGLARYIGHERVGFTKLPNHDIFPPMTIAETNIGTGDGTTTDFSVPAPLIVENSEVVKVGGVVKTKDTDYTIDYESNSPDELGLYAMPPSMGSVTGYTLSIGDGHYDARFDDFFYGTRQIGDGPYDRLSVSTSTPLSFDFGKNVRVNRWRSLFYNNGMVSNVSNIKYSTDGVTYTDVSNLTSVSNYLKTFDAVTARYFKVFYSSAAYTDADGTTTYNGISISGGGFIGFGYSAPAIHFLTPPANGDAVTISYSIDVPYKTTNNKFQFSYTYQWGRG